MAECSWSELTTALYSLVLVKSSDEVPINTKSIKRGEGGSTLRSPGNLANAAKVPKPTDGETDAARDEQLRARSSGFGGLLFCGRPNTGAAPMKRLHPVLG